MSLPSRRPMLVTDSKNGARGEVGTSGQDGEFPAANQTADSNRATESSPPQPLDELVQSLRRLVEQVEARTSGAKHTDGVLRQGAAAYHRAVEERLSTLRTEATDLVERKLRDAMRVSAEVADREPLGPPRAAALRTATQWTMWMRSASVQIETEWVASQRSVAEVGTAQLRGMIELLRQQNTAAINALNEVAGALSDAHQQLAVLASRPQVVAPRSPALARRSVRPKAARLFSSRPHKK